MGCQESLVLLLKILNLSFLQEFINGYQLDAWVKIWQQWRDFLEDNTELSAISDLYTEHIFQLRVLCETIQPNIASSNQKNDWHPEPPYLLFKKSS